MQAESNDNDPVLRPRCRQFSYTAVDYSNTVPIEVSEQWWLRLLNQVDYRIAFRGENNGQDAFPLGGPPQPQPEAGNCH